MAEELLRAEELYADQRGRWRRGERIRVEAYLGQYPSLESDTECVLQLINNEVVLREGAADTPRLEEYLQRFPQYRRQLEELFEVHRVLESAGDDAANRLTALPGDGELAPAAPWPAVAGYQILAELGRGGMGVVYQARQVALDRLVALKMIRGGALAGPEQVARFRTEALTVARLHHPHIVQIHDVGEHDGGPFLALELLDGGSLAQKLDGTPLPPRRAAELIQTLAGAMHYAHECGIVHRDLKPANVLLSADGTAKITDFGLAKRLDDEAGLTGSGQLLGTPSYMAPEQARGKAAAVGAAADVYALGAILYECLTGRPPFLAETALETLEQVRDREPAAPHLLQPKVPRDLQTICLTCLHKEPRKRYASAQALLEDLRNFLGGLPIQARPIRPWERGLKWARRRPAAAALLAVTGASAVALVAVVLGYDAHLRQKNTDLAAGIVQIKHEQGRTRKALDMLSSAVIDEWLSRQKQLLPEHKKFLEQALASYEELARDTGQDEASRAGVAGAHLRVGKIRLRLGQRAGAEAAYVRARDLYQQLAADFPGVPEYRQKLAASHTSLGVVLAVTGRVEDAERAYREALKLQQPLAADFPTVPEYRRDLAGSHNNLGVLLRGTGRVEEAERAYHDALKVHQQLAADFPTVPDYRQGLAGSHNNLGLLLKDTGRVEDAERAWRDALKVQQQLAADFPGVPDYRQGLAGSHNNLGVLLADTGRIEDAERAYRAALGVQQPLAADFPTVPEYRHYLATSHNNLGNLLRGTGRVEEAERAYHDALKVHQQLAADFPTVSDYQNELAGTLHNLADLLRKRKELGPARQLLEQAASHHEAALKANPRHPDYRKSFRDHRSTLVRTLLDLGEHGAAADTAAQLARDAVEPANDVYNAACFLCRCVPLAEHDARLSGAQRKDRAGAYADRAMATLRHAVQNGYQDAAHLKKDTDLDPLRRRADFQRLLAELEKK
jgi:serine/threonine protein kinase/Flp pilus assembly protein TadD